MERIRQKVAVYRRQNPSVFYILISMGMVYLLQLLLRFPAGGVDPISLFGLSRRDILTNFAWYQPVTYLFVHDPVSPLHLFFNGLAVFLFGRELESVLGRKRFLLLFFISGAAGGLLHVLFSPVKVIGASASVFAVLLAYAVFWPNRKLYLFLVLPVRAVVLVALLAALEVLLAFRPSGVSHLAHLGGLAAGGFLLILYRRARIRDRVEEYNRERHQRRKARLLRKQEEERVRVDHLLDKISERGISALARRERRFLDRASRHYGDPGMGD